VISGGSKGIGKAIACGLAAQGVNVVLLARGKEQDAAGCSSVSAVPAEGRHGTHHQYQRLRFAACVGACAHAGRWASMEEGHKDHRDLVFCALCG
jgi:NAD(P)-dependent dehydrogenase (short-subunit alcohol dehydrogenase family)